MSYTNKKEKVNKARTVKYDLFVEEYLANGFDAGKAAIKAGYKKKSARNVGYQLLADNEYVRQKVAERSKKLLEKKEITALRTLAEFEKIAFANMGDFVEIKEVERELDGGIRVKEQVVKIKDDIDMSIVKKVKTDRHGNIELELASKERALEALSKYSELAKEHELNINLEELKNININFIGK